MPFQVWARGASVQRPTLSPYARTLSLSRTHTHAHVSRHGAHADVQPLHQSPQICSVYPPCVLHIQRFARFHRYDAFKSVLDNDSLVSWDATSPGLRCAHTAVCGSFADTSPSSILSSLIFFSSASPSERASLFHSVCMWSPSLSSLILFLFAPWSLLQPYAWLSLVFLHLIPLW